MDDVDQILPGEVKTFEFEITAPDLMGSNNFQWRMIQEDVEWFGDASLNQLIVVGGGGDYLDDCDSKLDWNPGSLTLNNIDQVQGVGCLQYTGSSTDEYKKVFANPYNTNGSESETVLQFWYYVSDVSLLSGNNQVEIGSSGKPDVDEYSWSLNGVVSGWNFIQLNTSDAGKIGNPDLSAINWFRLYRFKSGSVTTRIDAIQLIGENSLTIEDVVENKSFNLFPNPASTEFNIQFTLRKPSDVSVSLINVYGQTVLRRKSKQKLNAGSHRIKIPVNGMNYGIYFARIKIDDTVFTKKVLIK